MKFTHLVYLSSIPWTILSHPSPFLGAIASPSPSFSWPAYPSLTYATLRPIPSNHQTFAKPYKVLSSLVANQTTTTWASLSSPTDSAAKFGNVAWSSLWLGFNITAPPFTTTMLPTPIPSTELIKPTPLPFQSLNSHPLNYSFPTDFSYGFAGAALQVEGAIKNEGRGPSITEKELIPRYALLKGGGPPDVTDLNYYLYKQDIVRLAAVGVKSYSFSISWSRILPFGAPGSPVNQEGIDHYDDLINTILEYGMEPIVTLNHFDTPSYYTTGTSWQGYDHPEFIAGFLDYAQIVLTHYSDRVGTWISFNEPGVDSSSARNWLTGYNIVMAHAKVVHWYRQQIKGTAKWSLKLSFSQGFPLPLDPSSASDVAAANRRLDFLIGYIAYPLYLGLQVPESVSSTLGSKALGFTAAELAYVRGTCDFFGVDLYGASYQTAPPGGIKACAQNSSEPAFPSCTTTLTARDGWNIGAQSNSGGYTTYQHVRAALRYLTSTYPTKHGVIITEFGFPAFYESSMSLSQAQVDLAQSIYYVSFLNEMLKAINEDGVKVAGAIGWAFVDNWEWGEYDDRYGVQAFNSTTLERSYKRSIFDFVDFVVAHGGN